MGKLISKQDTNLLLSFKTKDFNSVSEFSRIKYIDIAPSCNSLVLTIFYLNILILFSRF